MMTTMNAFLLNVLPVAKKFSLTKQWILTTSTALPAVLSSAVPALPIAEAAADVKTDH